MIDLYTWTTPNGRKVSILLEELGLPYTAHPIDITKDEQFSPDFLTISPNNKIPAIVDRETGLSLMESGAIMVYLADKAGQFLPRESEPRYRVLEWLMWQMGGLGPMLGKRTISCASTRARRPTPRSASPRRRIASTASWTAAWPNANSWPTPTPSPTSRSGPGCRASNGRRSISGQYPNVKRWYEAIAQRPAVQKGYDVPKKTGDIPMP